MLVMSDCETSAKKNCIQGVGLSNERHMLQSAKLEEQSSKPFETKAPDIRDGATELSICTGEPFFTLISLSSLLEQENILRDIVYWQYVIIFFYLAGIHS